MYGEKKSLDENQRFDWIKTIHWHRLVNIGWLPDIDLFNSIIWLISDPWEDLVNKDSNFADFVRFRPYTYARTHQFLPPINEMLSTLEVNKVIEENGNVYQKKQTLLLK